MMARFLVEIFKTDACKVICVIQKIFSMWTSDLMLILILCVLCHVMIKNVNIFIVFIVLKLIGLLSYLRSLL